MEEEIWDLDSGTTVSSAFAENGHQSVYCPPVQHWDENSRNSYSSKDNYKQYSNNRDRAPREGSWRNGPQSSGGSDGRRSFTNREDRNENARSNENFTEVEVDSNYIGKVIGRGGSKIKELQEESGAYIKVMKEGKSFGCTSVRISGSSEACDKAKSLIEELTSDFSRLSTNRGFSGSTSGRSGYNSGSGYSSGNTGYNSGSGYSSENAGQNSASGYSSGKAMYGYDDDNFTVIDWDSLNAQADEEKKKRLASLPPLTKEFYLEDPAVSAMTTKQVADFRKANNCISVCKVDSDDDRAIPNPITTFSQAFRPYPELLQELHKQGFSSPSPIQCQAWPIIMSGYDMIGIAQTGTGKTIAFLFPALVHIILQVTPRSKRVGPSCVVMAPTRELAQQIEVEAKKYSYHNISCVCIYGGGSIRNQINVCTKGVDIVIATPGRLNDLVSRKVIDVTGVTYLVLDEADRMLDLGFEPQIRKIVLDIRPDRQTIMTSATWTSEIQELAQRYMTKPMKVNVGALDLAAVHSVTQELVFADDDDRRELLMEFLASMGDSDKVIVFVERKSVADDVSSDLLLQDILCQSIHGDREQCDREQALDDFKTGAVKILVATDVASRGLDVKDITHVFNMYFPHNIEEYVHRVGRTGRAGKTGTAISIFTRQDWMHAGSLIKILEEANQFVPDELYEMADRFRAWKRKKDAEDAAAGGRRRFRGGGRSRQY